MLINKAIWKNIYQLEVNSKDGGLKWFKIWWLTVKGKVRNGFLSLFPFIYFGF